MGENRYDGAEIQSWIVGTVKPAYTRCAAMNRRKAAFIKAERAE